MRRQTKALTWVLTLLTAAVVGSIIGEVFRVNVPALAKGFNVGIEPPFMLDLNVITFTFGFTVKLNLAGAILALLTALYLGR